MSQNSHNNTGLYNRAISVSGFKVAAGSVSLVSASDMISQVFDVPASDVRDDIREHNARHKTQFAYETEIGNIKQSDHNNNNTTVGTECRQKRTN